MIRAVVAVPPVRDFYRTAHRHSALGPGIVYRILKGAGWDAFFFNFPVLAKRGKRLPLPSYASHLTPFILPEESGPVSFFTRFQHFGPVYEECREIILKNNPHIVFLSCFAFCYGEETKKLAEMIHKKKPDTTIAVGGAGASVFPGYFLKSPAVSLVFTGEIENTLPRFIRLYNPGIDLHSALEELPGICTKFKRTSHQPPDTFDPSWALTGETSCERSIAVSITRGCPKTCRFCSVHLSQGKGFRKAEPEAVIRMLTLIPGDKPIRCNFEDDNLLCDPSYFLSILHRFKDRFSSIVFTAENGIDYSLLTPPLLEELISLGFCQFNLSIASASSRILDREKREINLSLYEELLEILEKQAIPAITYFICGLEKDTPESVCGTLLYLAGKKTKIGISLFYPVPGIDGFTENRTFDGIRTGLTASSSAFPWNNSISTQQMVTAFRLARFINILKAPAPSKNDTLLINTIFSTRRLHTLSRHKGKVLSPVPVKNMDEDMVRTVLKGLLDTRSSPDLCC